MNILNHNLSCVSTVPTVCRLFRITVRYSTRESIPFESTVTPMTPMALVLHLNANHKHICSAIRLVMSSPLPHPISGEVNGLVQIHSDHYQLSQCIEAHVCQLSRYKFNANQSPTEVLLAAKRNHLSTFKIYIIELGPIREGNCSLISRTEIIPQLDSYDSDFPVAIECNTELGLIYLFSKFGSLYVCDIETGALILSALISPSIVFTTCFDSHTQTVMAITRSGQLLAIELSLEYLLRHLLLISKTDIAQRIESVVKTTDKYISDDDCDEVTRL